MKSAKKTISLILSICLGLGIALTYSLSSKAAPISYVNDTNLPTNIDNSSTIYFPKIMNQGNVGSCNSWALTYYQMTYSVNKALNRDASIASNIMSPTWTYTLTNKGINYGSYYSDVLEVLKRIGCVSVADVPIITSGHKKYVQNIRASKDYFLEASKYRIKDYYSIGPEIDTDVTDPSNTIYTDEDITTIKRALADGQVLTVSTYNNRWHKSSIKDSFDTEANKQLKGEKIITRVSGKDTSTHRLTLVGYNDNIWVDINKNGAIEAGEKGAFKLANSWGTSKDNDGYIWMCYDALKVNSSVDTSKWRNRHRSVGFYNIIGITVDVDNTDDDCYLALDIQTKDLESVNVSITATDQVGATHTYNPVPFGASLKNGLGSYPFTTNSNGDRGQFYIDLTNVIDNLTKESFMNYKWNVTITDSSSKKDVIIHSVKIYNKSDDTDSASINTEPIILNYNSTSLDF